VSSVFVSLILLLRTREREREQNEIDRIIEKRDCRKQEGKSRIEKKPEKRTKEPKREEQVKSEKAEIGESKARKRLKKHGGIENSLTVCIMQVANTKGQDIAKRIFETKEKD
jgi:ERCC4-type nuclease